MNAAKLGCSSTVAIAYHTGAKSELCTPHEGGLCVALVPYGRDKKDRPVLAARVTHVATGLCINSVGASIGDYPATKTGVTAALHELRQLLPLADWTPRELTIEAIRVDVERVQRTCRAAFPGKLLGQVRARDEAQPPAEVVNWTIYIQDAANGSWSVAEFADVDHLREAIDRAMACAKDCASPAVVLSGTPVAYSSEHVAYVVESDEISRTAVVLSSPTAFDLCVRQLPEIVDALAAARRELAQVDCPRKRLGVWKSGPKFGALKLPKLPPEECVEIVKQQERYDAQARKVDAMEANLNGLYIQLAEHWPIPPRVHKLCPRETPDGKDEAFELYMLVLAAIDKIGWSRQQSMLPKCAQQLVKQIREYESVETEGFAPRSRCIMLADPHESGDVDREVEVVDVIVERGERWSVEPTWWHQREVVDVKTGERLGDVNVRRLKVKS